MFCLDMKMTGACAAGGAPSSVDVQAQANVREAVLVGGPNAREDCGQPFRSLLDRVNSDLVGVQFGRLRLIAGALQIRLVSGF